MQPIQAEVKNLRQFTTDDSPYTVEYYQREYKWEEDQVIELVDDLHQAFQPDSPPSTPTPFSGRADRGHYFLGSIIVSEEDRSIVDGQQRLTSLTLLLICLHHLLAAIDDPSEEIEELRVDIRKFVRFKPIGTPHYVYRLNVESRIECVAGLLKDGEYPALGHDESVDNIVARYRNIHDHLSDTLDESDYALFCEWLLNCAYLVEIATKTQADAYAVFETMNDRGLRLTPTEMLKGFLLASITDGTLRSNVNGQWKEIVEDLQKLGPTDRARREMDADAIKAWFRAKLAKSIRERKRNAEPKDFDRIGTEFHRWIRDQADDLGLGSGEVCAPFITQTFRFFANYYGTIITACRTYDHDLRFIYYNAYNNFTLQNTVLLAPITEQDDSTVARTKIAIAAAYIDIVLARRFWNSRSTGYSTMQYNMFERVIKRIRNLDVGALAECLVAELGEETETFDTNPTVLLHAQNRRRIHYMLARISDFVATESEQESCYVNYVNSFAKDRYEIEHVLPNIGGEDVPEGFSDAETYNSERNEIGGLLLLRRSVNASLGGREFAEKSGIYAKQHDLLAQALGSDPGQHNPRFCKFCETHDLGILRKPVKIFDQAALAARRSVYQTLANLVWHPNVLYQLGESHN